MKCKRKPKKQTKQKRVKKLVDARWLFDPIVTREVDAILKAKGK